MNEQGGDSAPTVLFGFLKPSTKEIGLGGRKRKG